MIHKTIHSLARVFVLLFVGALLVDCNALKTNPSSPAPGASATFTPSASRTSTWTPTQTITPTMTPTQIPIQERDLSEIILQRSELSGDFRELEGRSGPECLREIYLNAPEVHENLVHGYNRSFISNSEGILYSSSLFVYSDADSAEKSFLKIKNYAEGEAIEMPDIGSEHFAFLSAGESGDISTMDMAWRDRKTLLGLSYFGYEKPDTEVMFRLAKAIQERMENPSAVIRPSAPAPGGGAGKIGFSTGEKIYIVNSDGSGLTCITKRSAGSISFSPDGKRLVFSPNYYDTGAGITIMNSDGTGFIELDGKGIGTPLWSPKEDRIIFQSGGPDYSLFAVDPDGNNLLQLTDFAVNDFEWYRNGEKISVTRQNTSSNWVILMNPDGSESTVVVKLHPYPFASCCHWSPDGRFILFNTSVVGDMQHSHISIMNADGTGQRRLTDAVDKEWYPDWSPDSKNIAFVYSYKLQIVVTDSSGGNRRILTDGTYKTMYPIWSPDGSKIAFFCGDYNYKSWKFCLMDADGGNLKVVTDILLDYPVSPPVWMPKE